MTRPRFFADEHVPAALISGLRQAGLDVQTAGEARLIGANDERRILPHLISEQRVLITGDHRFRNSIERRAVHGQPHPGVVFLKRPDRLALLGAWNTDITLIGHCLSADDLVNQVLFVPL